MSDSYKKVIEKLHSRGMFRINLGLNRISAVLNAFGNPQDRLKCIHIAGTNGKGSVCAILDAILTKAGYKTGLYTSPHIYEYTERIKISGADISQNDFTEYFYKVYSKSKELKTDLTEFEILTVIMFLYFSDNNVDIVILETGMGGRFDATNVIKKNICSVITHIDLDHTDKLGDTKEKIAFEKAGIIKINCPIITAMEYNSINSKAIENNSKLIKPQNPDERYIKALSLKGLHQKENLALALEVIKEFFPKISEKYILESLKTVKNPFRFEYFKDKNLVVDASHNPNGIKALKENLDYYFPYKPRRFVFGCLKTKNYEQMMDILFKNNDEIYLYGFDYPNACSYEELHSACKMPAKPYSKDLKLTPDKLNIICGSFYMIGKLSF